MIWEICICIYWKLFCDKAMVQLRFVKICKYFWKLVQLGEISQRSKIWILWNQILWWRRLCQSKKGEFFFFVPIYICVCYLVIIYSILYDKLCVFSGTAYWWKIGTEAIIYSDFESQGMYIFYVKNAMTQRILQYGWSLCENI